MTRPLDIPTLPLRGRCLIEASAGTGKTFTLAALYVRLVLGHGGPEAAFVKPLMPRDILVVTFTEAATDELKHRIRQRLRDARDALLGHIVPDTVLAAILDSLPAGHETRNALRLDQAMRMMDDASIFTIHGFCQRMLKQHAFDSGTPFQAELLADPKALFVQELEDYWRREFYPLPAEAQALVQQCWNGPQALGDRVRPLLAGGRPQPLVWGDQPIDAPATLKEVLLPALDARQQAADALEAARAAYHDDVLVILREAIEQGLLSKTQFKPDQLDDKGDTLRQWAQVGGDWPRTLLVKEVAWCSATRLAKAAKKGATPPSHPFFDALDEWQAASQRSDRYPLEALMLAHARDGLVIALTRRKQTDGVWDFDDLLNALDDALQGPMGARLAKRIRTELPVALIDEFQDTDEVQYRIFDTLYPAREHYQEAEQEFAGAAALLLIGDPKQAIYAFRNADINTYLRARHDIPTRYTLTRNFRSSHVMVDAVNRLFEAADEPFRHPDIPFLPVDAQGLDEVLEQHGQPVPALGCWYPDSDESVSIGEYGHMMSDACCHDVWRLLADSNAGDAGFRQVNGDLRPVRPADIAVLVRTGSEAQRVQEALRKVGIRSVYLSLQRSVFQTREAFWLLQLLEAVAHPHDDGRIRSVMGTRLMSDSLDEVACLVEDELRWERLTEQFDMFHRDWRQVGVLAMVRRVMQHFDISVRLLRRSDGERSLTDFMHLVELTQTASQQLDGELAVLRWLNRAQVGRFDSDMDPDSLIQRLESDDALVKVITIHKSKGLEYPIVYLPFVCDYRPEAASRGQACVVTDDDGRRTVAYEATSVLWERADKARLDENIRLLYVGLTRARHACRLGIAPLFKGQGRGGVETATTLAQSALGNLLLRGAERQVEGKDLRHLLDGTTVRERLTALSEPPVFAMLPLPASLPLDTAPLDDAAPVTLSARTFNGHIDRRWWIASYSALVRDRHSEAPLDPDGQVGMADSDREVLDEQTPRPAPPLGPIINFPRGPQAGTFLHGILQNVQFDQLQADDYAYELRGSIGRALARSGYDAGWGDPLYAWLMTLVETPLHPQLPDLALAGIRQWRAELEFWLPVTANVDIGHLDNVIRNLEPWAGTDYPELTAGALRGMLRGYIDMVFEYDGRWYVMDWKSNHLGDQGEDYRHEGMSKAMVTHRYDLQYVLYTLALHRQLSIRLPDYDYDRDMGGVLYLFVRGIGAQTPNDGQGVIYRRPDRALIERLDTLLTDASSTQKVAHV